MEFRTNVGVGSKTIHSIFKSTNQWGVSLLCPPTSPIDSGYVSKKHRVADPCSSLQPHFLYPSGNPTGRANTHLYINAEREDWQDYVWIVVSGKPHVKFKPFIVLSQRDVVAYLNLLNSWTKWLDWCLFLCPFWGANFYFTAHCLHTSHAHDSTVLCSPFHHSPICPFCLCLCSLPSVMLPSSLSSSPYVCQVNKTRVVTHTPDRPNCSCLF